MKFIELNWLGILKKSIKIRQDSIFIVLIVFPVSIVNQIFIRDLSIVISPDSTLSRENIIATRSRTWTSETKSSKLCNGEYSWEAWLENVGLGRNIVWKLRGLVSTKELQIPDFITRQICSHNTSRCTPKNLVSFWKTYCCDVLKFNFCRALSFVND